MATPRSGSCLGSPRARSPPARGRPRDRARPRPRRARPGGPRGPAPDRAVPARAAGRGQRRVGSRTAAEPDPRTRRAGASAHGHGPLDDARDVDVSAPAIDRGAADERGTGRAHTDLVLGGMTCGACANRIERKLNKVAGVSATVNYATEKASVEHPAALSADELIA